MISKEDTLELMLQKRDMVTEMLTLTRTAEFFGTEADIENYINLVDNRQKILDNIKEIDLNLEHEDHRNNLLSQQLKPQLDSIQVQIKTDSQHIINVENKNKGNINKAYGLLQKEMRGIKTSQSLKSVYRKDAPSLETQIDAKQ